MITEFVIAGALQYGYVKINKLIKESKYKEGIKGFYTIAKNGDLPFKVIDGSEEEYGYRLVISLKGDTYEKLEKCKELLEVEYGAEVELIQNDNYKTATMYILKNKLNDTDHKYKPIQCKPYEVFISLDNKFKPIIADMNEKPHILDTGATGTGKSQELKIMLCNLIHSNQNNEAEIYFSNISRTTDFRKFKNCKQVKGYVDNLDDSLKLFEYILRLFKKRMAIFEKYDCDDIKQYNKKCPEKQMSYVYTVIDEYAQYFPEGESDPNYKIKVKCKFALKEIARLCRKAGLILVICVQRPDTTVLDPNTRSNLTTKVAFAQENGASSLTVCDSYELMNIPNRKFLYMSGHIRQWGRSLYIDDNIIKKVIKPSVIKNRQNQGDFNKFLKENTNNSAKSDEKVTKIPKNKAIPSKKTKIVAINEEVATGKVSRIKNVEVINNADYIIENGKILERTQYKVEEA